MDTSTSTILVVDDEPEMREMISDYLTDACGYHVCSAESAAQALEQLLPNEKIDLIISDINMPGMKGFELLAKVRQSYPLIKRLLITAYNVEDYLELALNYDVGNIFAKTAPFNFIELSANISNLLTNDIFGAEQYFKPDELLGSTSITIRCSDEIPEVARQTVAFLPEQAQRKKVELVIVELLTNALFYGARNESPEDKTSWNHEFRLDSEQAIELKAHYDEHKYAIAITDQGGKLSKQDVLYWLNRQTSRDDSGMPVGILDTHGRGLFIARRYIDRFIINIDRNRKTEMIIINYFSSIYKGYKPLYINEL
jgi:CheY-like chemotaxis protein